MIGGEKNRKERVCELPWKTICDKLKTTAKNQPNNGMKQNFLELVDVAFTEFLSADLTTTTIF